MPDVIGPWRRSAEKQGYSGRVARAAGVLVFGVVLGTTVGGVGLGMVLLGGVFEHEYPWSWRLPAAVTAFAFGVGAAAVIVKGPETMNVGGKGRAPVYAAAYLGAFLPLIGFMIADEPGGLWALVLWLALLSAALVRTKSGGEGDVGQGPHDGSSEGADLWSRKEAARYLVAIVGLAIVLIGFAVWQLTRGAILNATVIASFAVCGIGIGAFAYLRAQR